MFFRLSKVTWTMFIILLAFIIDILIQWNPALNGMWAVTRFHFYAGSLAAALASIIAIFVGISGYRLRNVQVMFLSLAFVSLFEIFTVHALSTPGFLTSSMQLMPVAEQMSVTVASVWMLLSSLPSDMKLVLHFSKWKQWVVPVWVSLLGVIGAIALWRPVVVLWLPLNHRPLHLFIGVCTLLFNSVTVTRYVKSYRYSHFPLQIAIVLSAGLLSVAQFIILTSDMWTVSWWYCHILLVLSITAMLVGVIRQYAMGTSMGTAVRGLFASDPLERIEAGISPSVKALVAEIEQKDSYTAGHTLRVALYALRLGQAMGLSPEQLRALAQGGIAHDIGKVQIPDAILNKPGRLTEKERTVIEQHPVTGFEMCRHLGFMKEELQVIRSHHERWDGTGYPDRLKADEIPFLARILAVADVYDALTSSRAYREAWSHEKAMSFIEEQVGIHFDKDCVSAWAQVNAGGHLLAEYSNRPAISRWISSIHQNQ